MIKSFPKGFTLAEVLVTLVVIGVIAALTIPNLIVNIQDQQYKAAWTKTFSDLSQATSRIMQDNGGTLEGAFQQDAGSARDKYAQYLIYVKSCDNSRAEGCFINNFNQLNGTSTSSFMVYWPNETGAGYGNTGGLVLNNGIFVVFNTLSSNPTTCSGDVCGSITVDVNGFKKPNIIGKDIFNATIKKNSLTPTGAGTCINSPNTGWSAIANHGYMCSKLYLQQ